MSRHVLLSVLLALSTVYFVNCDCPPDRVKPLNNEGKVHVDVLCGYNSNYRPVNNHKDTVTVKVRLALKYISFDFLEETFTLHSWVAMTWKDELLTWDPSNYGNVKEIQIESHEIWIPRMALMNADATTYPSDSFYTTCLLDFNGTVTCVPNLAHSGMCSTSLTRWPYDVQNCTLYFGSWMHSGEQVNYTFFDKKPIVLDGYQNGPGWKLRHVVYKHVPNKYGNHTYPMLRYAFELEREAAGPAAIIVAPLIVIVLLTLSSLLLDINDNTRLMLGCFGLYGHFMFLAEIGYDIPKHSADTPIILLFMRDSMIVTMVSILMTLLLMSLRRRTLPPPSWIISINRMMNSGPGKYVVFTEFDPTDATDKKVLTEDGADNEERKNYTCDWLQFANLLNSFIFILSFLIYLVLVSVYIPRK